VTKEKKKKGVLSRSQRKYVLILAIITLISVPISYILLTKSTNGTNTTITAREGLALANGVAHEWNNDSVLVYVRDYGSFFEGECTAWYYIYYSPSSGRAINNWTTYSLLFVDVYYDNTYKTEEIQSSAEPPILNWTVDSDEAYSIAMKNKEIRAFMDEYPGACVDIFSLHGREDGNPVWNIEWVDWGFMDDPHWAKIQIDATTGEVFYVEADLSDGSSYLICFVPVVIIISILLVISLSMSKRFPNFFTATGFALFLIPTLYLRIYYSTSIFTFMTLVFAAVLWLGTKRRMSSTDLNMEHQQVYGLFGLLAADYFGLLIARFLLIPYSYPNLLWSSLLIINGVVLYILLSPSEGEGTGELLKPFKN